MAAFFEWEGSNAFDMGTSINEVVEGLFLCGDECGSDRNLARILRIRLVIRCCASPSPANVIRHNVDAAVDLVEDATVDAVRQAIAEAGPRVSDDDPYTFVFNIAADDSPMFDLSPWFRVTADLLEFVIERLRG